MSLKDYDPCPCGSGKKFKWCCQPIHAQVERAFVQDQDGQHETASRIMDEITREHPGNPEAWSRKAQLLYQNNRIDEAENALQKAFDINPDYAFAHFLRGLFREHEGEIAGALLLFRKAAELYDPAAKDVLSQVYGLIGESESKLNRPVAAKAALLTSLRLHHNDDLRRQIDEVFGDKSQIPLSARKDYSFLSPPASEAGGRRQAWDQALAGAATGKLADAARAFTQLTTEDANDGAAWYNLGLARAWLGENQAGIDALDRYVQLEPDEARAAAAWALAEVLRFGQGMEDQADYVEQSVSCQVRDPKGFFEFLNAWQRDGRLAGVQVNQEQGVITGMVVERPGLLTGGGASTQPAKLAASLFLIGDVVVLRSVKAEALDRARQEMMQRAGPALSDARTRRGPAQFGEVLSEAVLFPMAATSQEEAHRQIREHVQQYFEETWIHRPLRSLQNVPPIDAAGHPVLRKKLRGVVQFIEECAAGIDQPYDFNRLRHKLGLMEQQPVAAPPGAQAALDIDSMSAADLAGLPVESLQDNQLEQAYRVAQKLRAEELAGRFARAIVGRPPTAERRDRYPLFAQLVQNALTEGDSQSALNYLNDGEKDDCEHNEGHRRNDYELRRGQVLSKRGETDAARDVFQRLIERVPSELRYRGSATEAMLAAKQGASALQFAEQGLAKAREKNDRDSEQYFQELVAAARKQIG